MQKIYTHLLTGAAALAFTAGVASASIMQTTPTDGDLHLVYSPATGNLTVAVNGNPYGTVTLDASPSIFTPNVFGTSPEFYSDDNGDGSDLFFGVLVGQQSADVTLPGVLQTNLSEASLLSDITVASDTNGPALAGISISGGTASSTPEPVSMGLLALGGMIVLRRRRIA